MMQLKGKCISDDLGGKERYTMKQAMVCMIGKGIGQELITRVLMKIKNYGV